MKRSTQGSNLEPPDYSIRGIVVRRSAIEPADLVTCCWRRVVGIEVKNLLRCGVRGVRSRSGDGQGGCGERPLVSAGWAWKGRDRESEAAALLCMEIEVMLGVNKKFVVMFVVSTWWDSSALRFLESQMRCKVRSQAKPARQPVLSQPFLFSSESSRNRGKRCRHLSKIHPQSGSR